MLGVIQLVNVDMEHFGDQESFFLQSLCDYAAIAIENARSVEKIQELTITDDCTGLYNARHLYKTLETEVYRSARFGYEFSVLFIDLDHFKQVNDTHGHLIGSKLLAEIGYLVKAQLRLIDFAFRYGGDEFVVLLPQTGKDSALVVARRLRDSLRSSMFCKDEGLNLNVRASIGLATYPHDAKSPHDVIRQADPSIDIVSPIGHEDREDLSLEDVRTLVEPQLVRLGGVTLRVRVVLPKARDVLRGIDPLHGQPRAGPVRRPRLRLAGEELGQLLGLPLGLLGGEALERFWIKHKWAFLSSRLNVEDFGLAVWLLRAFGAHPNCTP